MNDFLIDEDGLLYPSNEEAEEWLDLHGHDPVAMSGGVVPDEAMITEILIAGFTIHDRFKAGD